MITPLQSASRDVWFIYKFRLDRIYSFGNRAIFIFWHCGLKLSIQARFKTFWGHVFPKWRHLSLYPQKTLPCAETRRLCHKAWKSVQWFNLGTGSRKKDKTGHYKTVKKSQKRYISPTWGEAPTEQICAEICAVVSNSRRRRQEWKLTGQQATSSGI